MLPQDTDWFRNQISAPPHEYDSPTSTKEKLERRAEFDRWLAEVKAEEREKVVELIRRQAEGSQLEGDQKAVTLYEGLIAFIYIQNPYRQENHATDSD